MSRSVFTMDTPKDCLHCKMRSVIYADGRGYQQCGLNTDGYKLESFFKEEDLKEGWISPKCPLVSEEDFIYKAELKKCPFCGGEVKMSVEQVDAVSEVFNFDCEQCESHTYFDFCNREEAIEAWNNRVIEAGIRAKAIDEFAERE